MHYKSLKTVNQSLKHKVNRCVLSLRLNECKLSASRTAAGRLFHTTGPARCQRENTPYSSSEANESGIVNKQSGGKKLKYVLKSYIGGTQHVISRMRNDDSALSMSTRCLGWNISETVRDRDLGPEDHQ